MQMEIVHGAGVLYGNDARKQCKSGGKKKTKRRADVYLRHAVSNIYMHAFLIVHKFILHYVYHWRTKNSSHTSVTFTQSHICNKRCNVYSTAATFEILDVTCWQWPESHRFVRFSKEYLSNLPNFHYTVKNENQLNLLCVCVCKQN